MQPLPRLFGRNRRYLDIDVSIREHIQERADELEAEGMPRKQAEQTARREFGNVALVEQCSREQWQWPALESFLADLKFTLRRLRKSPGFAITVLLTLAIGIGANTAVFSVVDGVLLKPLPYPNSNQMTALWLGAPGAGSLANNFSSGLQLSASMYFTFAEHNRTFQSLGVWTHTKRQRHRPRPAGGSPHCTGLRRRSRKPRRPCGGWPLALTGRSGSAWRQSRHAELRLLAATLRRGSQRDRPDAAA